MDKKTLFFYFLEQKKTETPIYRYQAISLALGFKKKGISFYSNINYWKCLDTNEFLFKKNSNLSIENYDYIIMNCQYFAYGGQLPSFFFKKNKAKTILIDVCDGLLGIAESKIGKYFDIILKQKNKKRQYPSNVKSPWVYGLSDHLLPLFEKMPKFRNKEKEINVSYRHIHSARELANKLFIQKIKNEYEINTHTEKLETANHKASVEAQGISIEEQIYKQSRNRHHSNYINRIINAQIVATFGGYFALKKPFDTNKLTTKIGSYFVKGRGGGRISEILNKLKLQKTHTYILYQWDSYRLWETFFAGSVVLNVDFDKYGVEFPVNPVNWKHYVGIDFNNIDDDIEHLLSLSDEKLKEIAENGRAWAYKNYSSEAQAERLLQIISKL